MMIIWETQPNFVYISTMTRLCFWFRCINENMHGRRSIANAFSLICRRFSPIFSPKHFKDWFTVLFGLFNRSSCALGAVLIVGCRSVNILIIKYLSFVCDTKIKDSFRLNPTANIGRLSGGESAWTQINRTWCLLIDNEMSVESGRT